MSLLSEIFDGRERPVGMLSSYDGTVTYVNQAAAQLMETRASELVGSSVTDIAPRLKKYDLDDSPIIRCLRSPTHETQHSPGREPGTWWVASPMPCADPVAPEIFGSGHWAETLERALKEHEVLVLRASIAMEHGRVHRLLVAASAASAEAMRRLDFIGGMIAQASTRPINPDDGEAVPL